MSEFIYLFNKGNTQFELYHNKFMNCHSIVSVLYRPSHTPLILKLTRISEEEYAELKLALSNEDMGEVIRLATEILEREEDVM